MQRISCNELKELAKKCQTCSQDFVFIDVRSPEEIAECPFSDFKVLNIPLDNFSDDLDLLDGVEKDAKIITVCKGGVRSCSAYELLEKAGFTNLYSLEDGCMGYCS